MRAEVVQGAVILYPETGTDDDFLQQADLRGLRSRPGMAPICGDPPDGHRIPYLRVELGAASATEQSP